MSIVRVIPFTEEEIEDIQLTVTDRMLELNHQVTVGQLSQETADNEIERLGKVAKKFSQYHPNASRKVANIS